MHVYDRYVNDYPDYPNTTFEECGLLNRVSALDLLTG